MVNVLLGGAIGDSLGMPFETKPADYPPLLAWDGKTFGGSPHHKLDAGQFTDDTQMSILVAESLIENRGFNPNHLSQSYLKWIESGEARGYGKTTLLALQNIKNGVHWSESGIEDSYGNGTAMRAAPFGIFFRNDKYSLINIVKIDSAITHRSNEAEAGALAIALTSYYAVNNDESDLLEKIVRDLPKSMVRDKLANLQTMLDSQARPVDILKILGTKADVRQTAPSALYCYLKFKNYQDAVEAAIRAGGDTDTTAAIVGALYGAKLGSKGIPAEYINQIEDKNRLLLLDAQLFSRNNSKYLGV